MTRERTLVSGLLLLAGCGPSAEEMCTARDQERMAIVEDHLPQFESRVREIEKELATLSDHDWAGRYIQTNESDCGNARSDQELVMGPRSGFAWCQRNAGHPWRLNYGSVVSIDEERIHLDLAIDSGWNTDWEWYWPRTEFYGELIRVRWGGRRYLVPVDRMVDFCNAVNGDPRLYPWTFLVREKDWRSRDEFESTPVERGEVPEVWQTRLLSRPLQCRVDRISSRRSVRDDHLFVPLYEWVARVDGGTADDLLPGMMLHAPHGGSGKVVSARSHDAEVVFRLRPPGDEEVPRDLEESRWFGIRRGSMLSTSQTATFWLPY